MKDIPILIWVMLAACIIILVGLLMYKSKTENNYKLECLILYSGGTKIGQYTGHQTNYVHSDGSFEFIDTQYGEIRVRGDWVLEPCR